MIVLKEGGRPVPVNYPLLLLLTMTIMLTTATIPAVGPTTEEAYAFDNRIIQNELQYNIDCMSATTCYDGPLPAFFPYTNIADVAFSDFAFVNQNAFQLNGMCLDAASCINLATNYDIQQFTFLSNVLQYNNQQNLGIMNGAAAGNTAFNQALQFGTTFGGIYQTNDQFNVECIASGCYNQAYNLASQGASIADTIYQSNIQLNGQCLDSSLCQSYALNYASLQNTAGNTLSQQNVQSNFNCVQGSVCFSTAENIALFGPSSEGNTVTQSNVQSIDGCIGGSSCSSSSINFARFS
jgi:hypothetical protein